MHEHKPLGILLGHCAHMARERLDARLNPYDVTPAQVHVLHYLYHQENRAPQCEVIEHLRVKPSTAGGILDRMEEKGLVERSADSSDGRKKYVALTEKGEKLQKQLKQAFIDTEQMLTSGFAAEEQEMLFLLLHRVIQNMEEDRLHD